MQVIRAGDLKSTPWQNGMGVTTEIAIEPRNACFTDRDFAWRISRAEIRSDAPFSTFPGYDRELVVLGPDSLILNGIRREPFEPFGFAGEEFIEARLNGASGFTFDLGIIFRRDVRCEMKIVTLPGDEPEHLSLGEDVTQVCLHLCEGCDLAVLSQTLAVGDSLIVSRDANMNRISLNSLGRSIVAVLQISATMG